MPFQVSDEKSIEAFIKAHQNLNIPDVALQLSKRKDLPKEYILHQINGKKKQKFKFPFLKDFPGFVFPSPRAFSQASSENSALFKSKLFSGQRLLDLTGGMGIDSYFFAKNFSEVVYIEKDEMLFHQTKKNFNTLNAQNIRCFNKDALYFIDNEAKAYDAIYIDPDRRQLKSKGVKIEDCSPNVVGILHKLWKISPTILIKFSPLLDISEGIKKLKEVENVYVVAIKNEVKEVLFQLKRGHAYEPLIHAIDIDQEVNYSFSLLKEKSLEIEYSDPLKYLYEANASLLKAGAFKSLPHTFNLSKIASQTHLYTSDVLIKDFPGRRLSIKVVSKPKKQTVTAASIVCKNYPLSANQLRAKFTIREDSNMFLYACKLKDSSLCWITATLL